MTTSTTYQIAPATRMVNVSYAIRDLAVVADQVARQGHKILFLNIGDPCSYDFATPPHMIEAATKAMRDGFNGYGDSLGEPSAIAAIRHRAESKGFQNIQGIMVGFGSGEVIDHCLTALPGLPTLWRCAGQALRRAEPLLPQRREQLAARSGRHCLAHQRAHQGDSAD
jgi:alanine-synthesizing transaminase